MKKKIFLEFVVDETSHYLYNVRLEPEVSLWAGTKRVFKAVDGKNPTLGMVHAVLSTEFSGDALPTHLVVHTTILDEQFFYYMDGFRADAQHLELSVQTLSDPKL